ncbi:MAG TPA: cupin domain-containing protein, partial [bacterium]|nr:cupin domain-containing protein [bacterium]
VDWKAFCPNHDLNETVISRGHINHTHFSMDYPDEGLRIISLIPQKEEYFLGKIEISAHKTIPSSKLPHAEQVCFHIIEGKFVLNYASREYVLKTGDCFAFPGTQEYECYNPDLLKTASSLLITCPSFIPIVA